MWQSADDDAGGLTLPQLASPSQQGASCAQERWREDSSPHGTTPRRAAKTQSAPGMRPLGSRGGSASSSTALKQAFGLIPNALQRLAGSGGADPGAAAQEQLQRLRPQLLVDTSIAERLARQRGTARRGVWSARGYAQRDSCEQSGGRGQG